MNEELKTKQKMFIQKHEAKLKENFPEEKNFNWKVLGKAYRQYVFVSVSNVFQIRFFYYYT